MATKNRQLTAVVDGEVYCAAQKAQEVLGMTYSALRNQVIAGNIRAKTPKGKRQLFYNMKDVEELARDLNVFSIHRRNKPTKFEVLKTREEMEECVKISQALFGTGRNIDERMETLQKNPETYYVLKDEGQIVGYTSLWPVKREKLDKLLGQTLPVKISKDDIETYKEGKVLDLYLNVIGVKPGFSKTYEHSYGARLISGLIGSIIKLGERGVVIENIAARSNSPQGIKLIKGLGFTEIEPLTPERRTFIIRVKESGIPFVLKYKQALKEYQEKHTKIVTKHS
jgi:hypothetical protein